MATDGPPDDLTGISWHDPTFTFLNRYTVLAYFERSPFFDVKSNNMRARKEGKDPAVPGVLESMPAGLEYVVQEVQEPNLFVIKKQLRKAPDSITPLAFYHVLDGTIYQAPTLHAVLLCRMRRCLWNIKSGLSKMQADLDPLHQILKGEEKRRSQANAAAPPPPVKPIPVPKRQTEQDRERWRKTDRIILHVLNRYPLPQLPSELVSQQHTAYTAQPLQQKPEGDAAPGPSTMPPNSGAAQPPSGPAVPGLKVEQDAPVKAEDGPPGKRARR